MSDHSDCVGACECEISGVNGAVMRVRAALDGRDDGTGVLGGKELESVRRDILALRKENNELHAILHLAADEGVRLGKEIARLKQALDENRS